MNEAQIKTVLESYVGEVNLSPDLEDRVRRLLTATTDKRRFRLGRRGKLALACAGALAVIVFGVFRGPDDAVARTLREVSRALTDVKTMHAKFYRRYPEGMLFKSEEWYADGKWRIDSFSSWWPRTFLQRDGLWYMYDGRARYATFEPGGPKGEASALDLAKEFTDYGDVTKPRTFRIESHAPVAGREAFTIVADRASDYYHSELVVDKKTNLPISISMNVSLIHSGNAHTVNLSDPGVWTDESRWTFEFNGPVDQKLFDPARLPTKPVDIKTEATKVAQGWSAPINDDAKSVPMCPIYDAEINPDGAIFLVMAAKSPYTCMHIRDASPTPYLLVEDYSPGGSWGDSKVREYSKVKGSPLEIQLWVPAEKQLVRPTELDATLYRRESKSPAETTLAPHAGIPLKACSTIFPSWQDALFLTDYDVWFPNKMATVRGEYYRDTLHDDQNALRWFEKAYEEQKKVSGPYAYEALEPVISCLKALGRTAEANARQAEYDELKKHDPMINANYPGRAHP